MWICRVLAFHSAAGVRGKAVRTDSTHIAEQGVNWIRIGGEAELEFEIGDLFLVRTINLDYCSLAAELRNLRRNCTGRCLSCDQRSQPQIVTI
jgi:hypothetical protein